MIKIINFLIPFLMEMLFGKKQDKDKTQETKVSSSFKKGFVYVVMMVSFSFNYFSINKIYTVSLKYITLSKENTILQEELKDLQKAKVRADLLKESLEYCMSNTYKSKKHSGKIN